ncbi:MAG TPA: hypothetical protein VD994_15335 [Prosthecobacter sp.]|nr:hypothetical protein [Prosthecobacter sp.]
MRFVAWLMGALSLILVSCDRTRDLNSAIHLRVTPLGKAGETYRGLNLYDHEVTLENRADFPIFLSCSDPRVLSDYLKKRNPRAMCYSTHGEGGASHLSGLDLMGRAGKAEVKPGQKLTFVAPLPLEESKAQPGRFRVGMYVYVDSDLRRGRPVRSEPVGFQP